MQYIFIVNPHAGESDNAAVRFHDAHTKAMSDLRLA